MRTTRVGSGRLARCLAWTLCLSLALAGWTDAQTATPDEAPAASGAPTIKPSTLSPPAEEDPQTPLVTMTFDASETLDRIARLHGLTREQAREELLKLFENYNKFGIQPNPVANVQPRPTTPFDCVWLEATDQLVCRGSERILDGMTEFLRIWANRGMQHVVLEIQHIDSPVDLVKEILLPGGAVVVSTKEQGESATSMDPGATSNSDGHVTPTRVASQTTVERRVPVYVNSLTADWRSRLTNAAQADPRTNQLFAPKITVYQAVQAVASSITQRQFVVGFHANGTGELEPVINEVREGWGVQLSPLVIADTGRIRLEGEIQQSQIVDVAIATLPPGQDAKQRSVQVPTVEQRVYRISTEIAADETLLLHPLELTRDGRRTYFLISAEVPRQKP